MSTSTLTRERPAPPTPEVPSAPAGRPSSRRPGKGWKRPMYAGGGIVGLVAVGLVATGGNDDDTTLSVPRIANIQAAGLDEPTDPGTGVPPVMWRLPDGTDRVAAFPAVTGSVDPTRVVAVFLSDAPPPGGAPVPLDVTGPGDVDPAIGQTFPVGDTFGRQVAVPDEATRLFVGFAEGGYAQHAPGWSGHDGGPVSVTVEVVPE